MYILAYLKDKRRSKVKGYVCCPKQPVENNLRQMIDNKNKINYW